MNKLNVTPASPIFTHILTSSAVMPELAVRNFFDQNGFDTDEGCDLGETETDINGVSFVLKDNVHRYFVKHYRVEIWRMLCAEVVTSIPSL